jgi:CRISPR-associated endonuclease Csn1
MNTPPPPEYVLGIDLGSNSLGWAMIGLEDGKPAKLLRAGVRVFEAATEGDRESGDEKSKNLKRRQMRLQRRQTSRRARRVKKVFRLLQEFGLLPPETPPPTGTRLEQESTVEGAFRRALADLHRLRPATTVEQRRQNFINALDQAILASDWFAGKKASGIYPEPEQTLPYILRAAALDERLEPYFLGRALYHLAQRRGFLSNRKAAAKKDEKLGEVKKGINNLLDAMKATGSRTLGEYFARHVSPSEERIRGPRRWTSRKEMYEPEFDQIWRAQAVHHPSILTAEREKELRKAIFFQRPTWFDPGTIGRCELEPEERRAPMYLLLAQRFRLLQTVNNLKVLEPGKLAYELTPNDRAKLIRELELKGDRTFDQIRKLLELPKEYKFNLEPPKRKKRKGQKGATENADDDENEKTGSAKLKGNRTNAAFYKVFGERWLKEMSDEDRDRAVQYAYAFEDAEKLREAAKVRWGLDEPAAQKLSEVSFDTGPAGLSRKAMQKLLPLLEAGKTYAEARREKYPEKFEARAPLRELPPVQFAADSEIFRKWLDKTKVLPAGANPPDPIEQIRNPAVMRSLTELRKVVNGIIRRHGKPAEIHIELLRELRNPKSARERIADANRENRAARDKAKKKIKEETGDEHPSDDDVRKVQLFDECKGHCVYCGDSIPRRNFYGDGSDVHIDHIIPRSLCPDNTFPNLVLCHSGCNAEKGDRTPYQAFTGERYTDIINRVKQFQGKTARRKLRRFLMNDDELRRFLDKFTERQLRDSAYASRVAAKYLGYLYGGVYDANGHQRIICTSGEATAELRKAWELFGVLGDGPTSKGGALKKKRHDHRHHAVDAVAVALTGQGSIQELTKAKWGLRHGSRVSSALLQGPWPNFVDSVRQEIEHIVVSHRVSKKVSGALHKDTIYSPKQDAQGFRHRRVMLTELSAKDVMNEDEPVIVDPVVRALAREKLVSLGGGDPARVFSDAKNLPCMPNRKGTVIPIRRVRIRERVKTIPLGGGRSARYAKPESNHHIEIYAEVDANGNDKKWGADLVAMHEAYARLKAGQPIVQRDHGPLVHFRFSLGPGDVLQCDDGKGGRRLLVVRSLSEEEKTGSIKVEMVRINDARQKKEIKAAREWITKSPNELRKWHARKVVVSPLGEVSEAHD